jgi:hypothetical protein
MLESASVNTENNARLTFDRSVTQDLTEESFARRTSTEKLKGMKDRCPCQFYSNLNKKGRKFRAMQYGFYVWLKACKNVNKLTCWQCSLFSEVRGFDNLSNLHTECAHKMYRPTI